MNKLNKIVSDNLHISIHGSFCVLCILALSENK